jgi:hypothetical protein
MNWPRAIIDRTNSSLAGTFWLSANVKRIAVYKPALIMLATPAFGLGYIFAIVNFALNHFSLQVREGESPSLLC